MIESVKRGRPRRAVDSSATSNFTVRFTEEERKAIHEAAELRGVKDAALHREAVLDRAVHIKNATPGNRAEFMRLAERVARSQEPRIRILDLRRDPDESLEAPDGTEVRVGNVVREFPVSRKNEEGFWELVGKDEYDFDVVPGELSKADREALVSILRTAGTEFLPILAEFLETLRPEDGAYSPEITRESLRASARSKGAAGGGSDLGAGSKKQRIGGSRKRSES